MTWTNIFDGGTSDRFFVRIEKNWNYIPPEDYEVAGIVFSLSESGEISVECESAYRLHAEVVPFSEGDVAEAVRLDGVAVLDHDESEAVLLRSRDQSPDVIDVDSPAGTIEFAPHDAMWRSVYVAAGVFV